LALAGAVALAAHFHGVYLKQRNSRFGPHSETTARDFSILSLMTFLLLVAVTVAGWARYSLALHSLGAQGPVIQIDGLVLKQINPLTDVYFSLGVNLIVWLIGLAVAFVSHDENHELMSAEHDKWRKDRRFNKAHSPWEKLIKVEKAKASLHLSQLRAATKLAIESTKPQRDLIEQINNFEERVVYGHLANQLQSVVDLYRMALGGALAREGNCILVGENKMTGPQFAQHSIRLTSTMLRQLHS